MIAVDTQLLVYAHRGESSFHTLALRAVTRLAESNSQWAIPWPCVYEFINVVTHPKIYSPASRIEDAFLAINAWGVLDNLHFIGEVEASLQSLEVLCQKAKVSGGLIHDAKIAAICLANGVERLWTIDRDFSRFPELKTENPVVGGQKR